MLFLYSREVSAVFSFHLSVFRFTKERLKTSIDTNKKNNYIKNSLCFVKKQSECIL